MGCVVGDCRMWVGGLMHQCCVTWHFESCALYGKCCSLLRRVLEEGFVYLVSDCFD